MQKKHCRSYIGIRLWKHCHHVNYIIDIQPERVKTTNSSSYLNDTNYSTKCHHLPKICLVESHIIVTSRCWSTTGTMTWWEAPRKSSTKSSRHSATKLGGQFRYNSTDFRIILVLNNVGWICGDVLEGCCQLWILNGKTIHTLIRSSQPTNAMRWYHQRASPLKWSDTDHHWNNRGRIINFHRK